MSLLLDNVCFTALALFARLTPPGPFSPPLLDLS